MTVGTANHIAAPWLLGLNVGGFWWDQRLRKESGLTAEALAEQAAVLVLLEAVGAVVGRQGAVFQGGAEHGAHRLIGRLCRTER